MGLPSFYTLWHPDPKPKESLLQHTPPKFNMEPEHEWKWWFPIDLSRGLIFRFHVKLRGSKWIVDFLESSQPFGGLKIALSVVSWFLPFLPRLDPMSTGGYRSTWFRLPKNCEEKKPSEYQRFGEPVGSMGLVYVFLFVCYMYIYIYKNQPKCR